MKKFYDKVMKDFKRWTYLVAGLVCIFIGVVVGMLWSDQRENMLLTVVVIMAWPGGIYLIYRSFKKSDTDVVIVGADKPTTAVNSLNIYAKKDKSTGKIYPEKIAFEWINEPMGQPQQCTNNGRWYYVHIWDIETNLLKAFTLPDNQYFDPREFANVIRMPAHNKLFEQELTLLQKASPFIMVAVFVIALLGMVMTTPVPTG